MVGFIFDSEIIFDSKMCFLKAEKKILNPVFKSNLLGTYLLMRKLINIQLLVPIILFVDL